MTGDSKNKKQLIGGLEARQQCSSNLKREKPSASRPKEYQHIIEDMALVNLLNDAINRGDSLQKVTRLLSRETKKMFSSFGATVYLLSNDKEYLVAQNNSLPPIVLKVIRNLIGTKLPATRVRMKAGGFYSKVIQEYKPQVINDPAVIKSMMADFTENQALQKLTPKIYQLLRIHSVMCVPLISGSKIIGLVDISRSEPFVELDLKRFVAIAKHIGIATDHKLIVDEMQRSHKFLDLVFNSMFESMMIIDLDYRITEVNSCFLKYYGYSHKEVIKHLCYEITHGNSRPCTDSDHPCPLKTAMKTKLPCILQHIHKDKHGEDMIVEISCFPILGPTGKVTQLVEMQRDITERKKAEEQVRISNERLQYLLSATSAVIYSSKPSGVYAATFISENVAA